MLIFIYFLFVALLFARPKSKYNYYISFILLYILFAFNTDNADRSVYESRLLNYDLMLGYTEPGFTMFMTFMNKFHIELQGLYIIVATFYLGTMCFIIKKLSNNPGFVLGGYMIFCFFYDVVQVRTTTALIFVYIAFYFLLKEEKKVAGISKFLIFILIASQFHALALTFSIFCLIRIENKKKMYIIFFAVAVLMFIFQKQITGLFGGAFDIMDKIQEVQEKNANDYEGTNSYAVTIAYLLLIVTPYLVFYWKSPRKVRSENLVSDGLHISLISLLTIPIIFMSADFRRIYFAIFPILLLTMSNYLKFMKDKWMFKSAFIICMFLAYYRSIYFSINFKTVFLAIFENNLLFD